MSASANQDAIVPSTQESPESPDRQLLDQIPEHILDDHKKLTHWINSQSRTRAVQDIVYAHRDEYDMMVTMWRDAFKRVSGWKDQRL